MGFFRRDKSAPAARDQPALGEHDRAQIGPDELDDRIEELEQIVVDGLGDAPIERDTLELLQVGLPYLVQRECSDEAVVAGQTAARLGYLSRAAEYAMFDGDLGTDEDLLQTLGERLAAAEADGTPLGDAIADLAAAMAIGESLDPSPSEGGPSWTLPGLGGHSRSLLCDNLTARLRCPPDVPVDDLKRTWKFGYFLRVLEELCAD